MQSLMTGFMKLVLDIYWIMSSNYKKVKEVYFYLINETFCLKLISSFFAQMF